MDIVIQIGITGRGTGYNLKGVKRVNNESKNRQRANYYPIIMNKVFVQDILDVISLSNLPYNWNSFDFKIYKKISLSAISFDKNSSVT